MTATPDRAREQLFKLLPLEAKDAVPWTSRQLYAVSGLAWEVVTFTVGDLRKAGLIRAVGGSRGRGYLWVRTCEALPPDRRGRHGHHPAGADHYRRLQRHAASGPKLRLKSTGRGITVNARFPASSPLDAWPRLLLGPDIDQ